MDKKIRDVRRVFSRQSVPNNNNKLVISGDLKKKKKKKKLSKEKVKRLSVVEREMGYDVEDTGKLMLPRKIFSDSKTSVPRKLRSAIRKRSCESPLGPLPDARRSNSRVNDVDLLRKDSLKKSKISMNNGLSDHSSRGAGAVTISKDEEEVAETLFALAGMIPLNGRHVNNKNENESLGTKTSSSWNKQHSDPTPSSEDPVIPKEEPVATNPTTPTTNTSPRDFKLSERRQLNLDFKVSVPPVHFQIPPLLRACDDGQLTDSTFCSSTEQNQDSRFNDAREEKSQHITRESHIKIGAAELPASHDRKLATSMQCRDSGLTSRPSHGSGIDELPVQSSSMIFPSWLNNTSTSKPSFCEDIPSASKASGIINGGRKSWRRCVAHVYISHLIQALQTSEGKDAGPSDTCQLKPSQQSSAGQVADKDDLDGTLAAGMFGSAANDVPAHLKNGQIVEKEGTTFSGCCDSKKQSYNFLSLSTGVGPEVNNGVNRLGITLEAKGHVLQLHSIAQQNTYMPSSMPQNHFPTISYQDQVAVVSAAMSPQVHLQVPSYFGNPREPVHMGTTRSTQQPQPKQQQMWTTQLAAQFRPGPLLSSHIANWQNNTRDPRSMNHMQAHLPPPRPSQETTGSKYLHISQQQQQQLLGLRPSFPTSNAKLQNSQLPSLCEDKGGRFHPDGVLPLQLLCKERLLS